MENINPFWHGTPVPPDQLINRQRELRTLIGRIITGQSTAISGAPRSGKTSLLHYLMAPEKRTEIYGPQHAERLIFSYLDAQAWGTEFDIPEFWKETLLPLSENPDLSGDSSPFAKEYKICEDGAFGTSHLQKLLKQLKKLLKQLKEKGKQLVLMIDGTERLLRHPLNKTPFWGGMRHLASHSQGALVVILTTNTSVDEFYKKILTTTGAAGGKSSAYFNIMEEIILGPLADRDITQLLATKENLSIFTEDDQRFLKDIAGGHPYFLQMAASILYEEERGSINSLRRVKEVFYGKVKSTLEDIWSSWSYSTQGAFISVALTQVKVVRNVFKKPEIDIDKISRNVVSDYKTELDYLKSQGFLIADNNVPSGWRVCPSIFLPFILATKLKQEYREKMPKEVWDNLFDPTFGQT